MKEIKYMPAAIHSIYSMNGNSKAKASSLRNMPAQKIKWYYFCLHLHLY